MLLGTDPCKAFSVLGAGLGGLPITLRQPSVPTGSSPCKLGCMERFTQSGPGMSSLAVLHRDRFGFSGRVAWRTHTAHGTGTFKETWLELPVSQPLCLQTPPSPAHTSLTHGSSCHYIPAESQAAGRRHKPLDHGLGTGNAITRSFCEFGN